MFSHEISSLLDERTSHVVTCLLCSKKKSNPYKLNTMYHYYKVHPQTTLMWKIDIVFLLPKQSHIKQGAHAPKAIKVEAHNMVAPHNLQTIDIEQRLCHPKFPTLDFVLARVGNVGMTRSNSLLRISMYNSNIPLECTQINDFDLTHIMSFYIPWFRARLHP